MAFGKRGRGEGPKTPTFAQLQRETDEALLTKVRLQKGVKGPLEVMAQAIDQAEGFNALSDRDNELIRLRSAEIRRWIDTNVAEGRGKDIPHREIMGLVLRHVNADRLISKRPELSLPPDLE